MLLALINRLKLLAGCSPGCDWVAERLMAYLECALELSDREYAAIDAHLASCPRCAEEYETLSEGWDALAQVLYPGDALPHIDCAAMARAVVAKVAKSEGTTNIYAFPPPKRQGRLRLSAVGLAAAAMALIVVASVLGYTVYRAVSNDPEDNTQSPPTDSVSSAPVVHSKASHPNASDTSLSPDRSGGDAAANAPEGSDGIMQSLDQMAEAAIIRAQVEAMLPHTEEEYEAWARKEYPHIMWLYDVLMGKIPEKPADSPAGRMVRFGVDQNGNPTITLPNADGHPETFTFSIPPDHTHDEPLWDGTPINIPEWAEKLYADTPENQRPTGWRALLIYSGEIFKFDWPVHEGDPNSLPSTSALRRAAEVSGFAQEFSRNGYYDVSHLRWVDSDNGGIQRFDLISLGARALNWKIPLNDMLDSYTATLASDVLLATSALRYHASSSKLVHTPRFDEVVQYTTRLLHEELFNPQIPECNVRARRTLFEKLLDRRWELLECLTMS